MTKPGWQMHAFSVKQRTPLSISFGGFSSFELRHSFVSSFVINQMAYLDQFLSVIVKHGGSDLHFAEGQPPKMRVHGDIMPIRAETWILPMKWMKPLVSAVTTSSSQTVTVRRFA